MRIEAAAFLAWWLAELRACGEALLARIAPRSLTRSVIELDAAGGRIFSVRGQDRKSLLEFSCEVPGAWPEAPERFGSIEGIPGTRAVAVLAREFALVHHLHLPRSLARELDSVIPLQLERELPLPADRVALDWRVLKRPRAEPRIRVEVLIVHRAVIERVQSLARALRVELVRISLVAEGHSIAGDFLRGSRRASPLRLNTPERRLAWSAGALAVLWGLVIGGQWLYERVRVGHALKDVAPHALHADRLEAQVTREAAPAVALATLMREPDALDVLTELTETVPKDSWAYELDISAPASEPAEIRASAFTPAAPMLVDLLGRSPHFEHVQTVSSKPAGLFAGDRLSLTARWARLSTGQAARPHLARSGGHNDRG